MSLALAQTLVLAATAFILRYADADSTQGNVTHNIKPLDTHWGKLDTASAPSRLSLALLSFATASQIAAARAWDLSEITTAMATGALVDLFNDPQFFARHNRRRNLRAVFFVVLVLGCVFAAGLKRWLGFGSSGLLAVSVGVKGVVVGVLGWMGGEEGDCGGNGGVVGVGGDGGSDLVVDVDVEGGWSRWNRGGEKPG